MDALVYVFAGSLVFLGLALVAAAGWYGHSLTSERKRRRAQLSAKQVMERNLEREAKHKMEQVVAENAQLIKKDIDAITHQLTTYLRKEVMDSIARGVEGHKESVQKLNAEAGVVVRSLREELRQKQAALIDQLNVDQQRLSVGLAEQHQALAAKVEAQVAQEAARRIEALEVNMARIIQSYVKEAVSTQLDVDDEFAYIMREVEAHKDTLLEELRNGTV